MAMMNGIVEETAIKEVSTKFGIKPTYSFKVGGAWIKCGFKNPNIAVGYTVDFDASTGTYGLETKAVNIISKATSAPSGVPTVATPTVSPTRSYSSGSSYKEKVFPIPALHGDRAIVRQNALARATDLYVAARGGKPFDLEISTLDLVISFARKFEAYTAGDIDLAEAIKEDNEEAKDPS